MHLVSTVSDLRIATRGSRLALAQARAVAASLCAAHTGLDVSLVEITSTGDVDKTTPVSTLTEVGAFVRSIQLAVLDGAADIAVHSCKDLPVSGPPGLVAFYPEREEPWDVLCGHDLESLPDRAKVGTGSPRRAAQLRILRPDVDVVEIRGNVDTRLEKMRSGEYDAIVLAESGLLRLGIQDEVRHRFSVTEMVPAPGQAAIAVEAPTGSRAAELAQAIDHRTTRLAVESERALLENTASGCRSALGALAVVSDTGLHLTGFVADGNGPRFGVGEGPDVHSAANNLQSVLGL
jgi:hydroxymethylbilane synthase